MEIRLPMHEPIIWGRMHHAIPHSIVEKDENYYNWLYSNYIQMAVEKTHRATHNLNFYEYYVWDQLYPFFTAQKMTTEILDFLHTDVVSFVKAAIRQGYYPILYMDEYYLSPLQLHNDYHLIRDIAVVGFNDDTHMFYIYGLNKLGNLDVLEISFEELLKGFRDTEATEHWQKRIILIKPEKGTYDLDIDLIKMLLEDYLESRNTSRLFRMIHSPKDMAFGLESLLQFKTEIGEDVFHPFYNMVPAHMVYEHKTLMIARIQFLSQRQVIDPDKSRQIVEQYTQTQSKAKLLKTLFMKMRVKRSAGGKQKLMQLIDEIVEDDKRILSDFHQLL